MFQTAQIPVSLPTEITVEEPPKSYSDVIGTFFSFIGAVGFTVGLVTIIYIGIAIKEGKLVDWGLAAIPLAIGSILLCITQFVSRNLQKPGLISKIKITPTTLHCKRIRLDGTLESQFQESLKNFEGVQACIYARVRVSTWRLLNRKLDYEQITVVELTHRAKEKCISLQWATTLVNQSHIYHIPAPHELRLQAEGWARLLKLPTILGKGAHRVVRVTADIDAPLYETDQSRAQSTMATLMNAVPRNCKIVRSPNLIEIYTKPNRPLIVLARQAGIIFFFLGLNYWIWKDDNYIGWIFTAFIAYLAGLVIYGALCPHKISIDPERITTYEPDYMGIRKPSSISKRSIETIRIGSGNVKSGDEILIESDQKTLRYLVDNRFETYEPATLTWLRDYLTALIKNGCA